MTTPYPESTSPWVVRSGEPGLPLGYQAAHGYGDNPAYVNYPGYTGYGTARGMTYGQPVYTYRDLDSMWGKGPAQVYGVKDMLYRLGYLSRTDASTPFWSKSANSALQDAMADANKNGITLDQMYQANQKNGGGNSGSGSGSGSGGGRSVSTSSSVSLTSKEAAHQILGQALAQQLGRQPTAAETAAFLRSLNATEKANPSTSTTVSTFDGSGNSHSSTTSKSVNINPSAEADAWTQNNSALAAERKGYQGALYFDVIGKMLGI